MPSLSALIRRHRPLAVQFGTYVGVGLAATAAHFSTLLVLVERAGLGPVTASAAGFLVGGVVSYVLNRQFTFAATRSHAAAVPRFALVAAVAFALNAALMDLFVHDLDLQYLLAQALTTLINTAWTFTGHRLWAFAHRAPEPDQAARRA